MLTVYAIPVSLYCAKLRIVLRQKNLRWQELPPPGGYGSDEYAAMVPGGNLPALLDGDIALADSEAIAEYLNEAYPQPPMLPDKITARAKVRERGRFHDTRLEPVLRVLFSHIAPETRDAVVVHNQSQQLTSLLACLSQFYLSDETAFASELTLGDCGFPITLLWVELLTPVLGLDITWPKRVSEYLVRLRQFEAVSAELADYQPKLERWLQSDDV